MASQRTTRRRYLLTAGAGLATALAGCGGDSDSTPTETSDPAVSPTETDATATEEPTETPTETEELPEDTNPDDGFPPEFDDQPEAMEYSASEFDVRTESIDGTDYEIPVVPLDVAYNLYARREARIVDARSQAGYDISHVFGAVRSLEPSDDGPIQDWDKSDTVITYCHCPYHNAVRRGAQMRSAGFEEVFALEMGLQSWKVAGHPTEGEGVPASATTRTIEGESDAESGDIAYVYHLATDQVAGAEIESGGSYTIEFAFADAAGSDDVAVGTPGYKVSGTLSAATSGTVTSDGIGEATGTATANGTGTANGTDGGMGTGTGNVTGTATDGGNGTANGTATETDDSTFGRLVGGYLR